LELSENQSGILVPSGKLVDFAVWENAAAEKHTTYNRSRKYFIITKV
jgi:hypothetical protein